MCVCLQTLLPANGLPDKLVLVPTCPVMDEFRAKRIGDPKGARFVTFFVSLLDADVLP
jgi:hypothetical protein